MKSDDKKIKAYSTKHITNPFSLSNTYVEVDPVTAARLVGRDKGREFLGPEWYESLDSHEPLCEHTDIMRPIVTADVHQGGVHVERVLGWYVKAVTRLTRVRERHRHYVRRVADVAHLFDVFFYFFRIC